MIAIDGKALRRSHDRKHNPGALFLVSAWSVAHGVSQGQLAAEEKSNEITAILELLNNLDVAVVIVTIAAKVTREIRYFISSLCLGVKRFAALVP